MKIQELMYNAELTCFEGNKTCGSLSLPGALPDIRGGFKHVPRVRLKTPLIVRGTCGNRTHVDQVQVKRL